MAPSIRETATVRFLIVCAPGHKVDRPPAIALPEFTIWWQIAFFYNACSEAPLREFAAFDRGVCVLRFAGIPVITTATVAAAVSCLVLRRWRHRTHVILAACSSPCHVCKPGETFRRFYRS